MLVVLLLTSWAALDTSLSQHDSILLIKSGGIYQKVVKLYGKENKYYKLQCRCNLLSKFSFTNYNVDVTYFLNFHLHACKTLNCSFNNLQNSDRTIS